MGLKSRFLRKIDTVILGEAKTGLFGYDRQLSPKTGLKPIGCAIIVSPKNNSIVIYEFNLQFIIMIDNESRFLGNYRMDNVIDQSIFNMFYDSIFAQNLVLIFSLPS